MLPLFVGGCSTERAAISADDATCDRAVGVEEALTRVVVSGYFWGALPQDAVSPALLADAGALGDSFVVREIADREGLRSYEPAWERLRTMPPAAKCPTDFRVLVSLERPKESRWFAVSSWCDAALLDDGSCRRLDVASLRGLLASLPPRFREQGERFCARVLDAGR